MFSGQDMPAKKFPVAIGLWLLVVGAGAASILRHANTPGAESTPPAQWPAITSIHLDKTQPTLVMFAHPRCPCTRASLEELAQVSADCSGRFDAQIWFIKPPGTDNDWTNSPLWRQAAAIPGVSVHCDDNGIETHRFHAETSGQTVLYDTEGHLLFHGGITLSRGHTGENPAQVAVETLLEKKISSQVQSTVYGCPLFSPERLSGNANSSRK